MQDFINKFWEKTVAPSLRKVINENKDNSERVVNALNEISNEDITSAQEDTTEAIKGVQETVKGVQETIKSISYEPIQEKLDTLIQTVQEKNLSVSVGETIVDTKGIIKSIQELKKAIPRLPKQMDYTSSFEKLLSAFSEYSQDDEKESKGSHRVLVEQLLSRLATTQDVAILAEWLRVISEKEEVEYPFKFSDKGRLLIEVDRVGGGGGGGGLTRIEAEALISIPEKLEATEDPLTPYKITDKDDDASPNYFGFTKKDGSWYIMKETVSSGADTYRYVAGTEDYTTNWTNRASLSYDYFYTTF